MLHCNSALTLVFSSRARQFLEAYEHMDVLGGLISPSHSSAVRLKLKRDMRQVIPSMHRIAMGKLAIEGSDWLTVDPWEATRLHMLDYMSLIAHVQQLLATAVPAVADTVQIYLFCKYTRLVKLSPSGLRKANIQCICVCRPAEVIKIVQQLEPQWRGLVTVVEDTEMLPVEMATISSSRIRRNIINGVDVASAVTAAVNQYARENRLAEKVRATTTINTHQAQSAEFLNTEFLGRPH